MVWWNHPYLVEHSSIIFVPEASASEIRSNNILLNIKSRYDAVILSTERRHSRRSQNHLFIIIYAELVGSWMYLYLFLNKLELNGYLSFVIPRTDRIPVPGNMTYFFWDRNGSRKTLYFLDHFSFRSLNRSKDRVFLCN